MNEQKNQIPTQRKNKKHTVFGMLIIASFFLILISTDVAIDYMKKGLRLCSATVIPSLFPFMVISELIVSSGIGVRISKLFAKPMLSIFGVNEAGAAAYLLGLVCGFPIGAKTAVALYDQGTMTKKELERLLTFCNNPGSAFVISAVGVSLLGNKKIGIALYLCVIFSSIIVGIVGKYFLGYKKADINHNTMVISGDISVRAVTNAIQSSAMSMLSVCAYVVFFSAFVGCIGALLSRFSLPNEITAGIFGFFELSSGVGAAADCSNKLHAILLCALFSGWSGLSVGFQIMSVCSGRNISFKPYFIAKASQGVICALLAYLSVKCFFPSVLSSNSPVFSLDQNTLGDISRYLCLALFLSALIFSAFTRKKV